MFLQEKVVSFFWLWWHPPKTSKLFYTVYHCHLFVCLFVSRWLLCHLLLLLSLLLLLPYTWLWLGKLKVELYKNEDKYAMKNVRGVRGSDGSFINNTKENFYLLFSFWWMAISTIFYLYFLSQFSFLFRLLLYSWLLWCWCRTHR